MKKFTKKQIVEEFQKVMTPGNMFELNDEGISLVGRYSSDELREIARVMDTIFKTNREVRHIQNLVIKGFKSTDIKVLYYKMYEDDESYRFSFYIMKDGKDWNFYYGKSDQGAGDWWPDADDGLYLSPIHDFIPRGFAEECENTYEYRGTNEEAIALLKDCGFTVEPGKDQC